MPWRVGTNRGRGTGGDTLTVLDMPPRKLLALAGRRSPPVAAPAKGELGRQGELQLAGSPKPGTVVMMPAGLCASIAIWVEGRTCIMA